MFLPSSLRPLPGLDGLLPAEARGRSLVALTADPGHYRSERLARDLGAGWRNTVWLRVGPETDLESSLVEACRRRWRTGNGSDRGRGGPSLRELLEDAPRDSCVVIEWCGRGPVEMVALVDELASWVALGPSRLIGVAADGLPSSLGEAIAPTPTQPDEDVRLLAEPGGLFARLWAVDQTLGHDVGEAARLWGAAPVAEALATTHRIDDVAAVVTRRLIDSCSEPQREILELASRAGYWHPDLGSAVGPLPTRPWMIPLEHGWWWVRPRWRSALSAALRTTPPARSTRSAPEDPALRPAALGANSVLEVKMLGNLEVSLDGHQVEGWSGRVGVNALRYLLTRRSRACPRDELLAVFWPDVDPAVARNRLQVALSALRRSFREVSADPVIEFRDGVYRINSDFEVVSDVDEFEAAVSAAGAADRDGDPERALSLYAEAARLYRGDLAPDAPYDDWCLVLREGYKIQLVDVLDRLCALQKEAGRIDECIAVGHRLLEIDPCREDAHRLLMWCYGRQGRAHQATRQYEFCSRVLKATLEMCPSPETVRLLQEIRAGALLPL